MALRRWEHSKFPSECQSCHVKIPAADPRFEDREARVVLCDACGVKVVAAVPAGPSPSHARAPPAAPAAPKAPADVPAPTTPPAAPEAVPKRAEFDLSTAPRVSVGLTIGLPGYSSAKACIEATGEAGEGFDALRERLERDLLQQLARQVMIALAASKDPATFVRTFGDPADPVVAAAIESA